MADPRFYPAAEALSISAIVELVRGEKKRGCSSLMARHIASAEDADEGALCFVVSPEAAQSVPDVKGVICLISPDHANALPSQPAAVLTPDPKRAFGLVLRKMFPDTNEGGKISALADIHETAIIGENVRIDGGASIAEGVELGAGVWVKSGASIGRGCVIGQDTVIESNAVINYAMIGDGCVIGANTVIGQTGFGVGRDGGNILVPHMGRVLIGDRCNIGASVCIDRGFLEDTTIGHHVMMDNLVHIAHNVKIGNGNVICGQVGFAGSTVIGDNNIFGAQSGVADHITIGSGNVFAARAGVTKSIGDGQVLGGFPAVPAQEFRRQIAALRRLAAQRKSS